MTMQHISIHHLYFTLPDGTQLFRDLNADFGCIRTGIVGSNGVGKSTLLKLIMNEFSPQSGIISGAANRSLFHQNHTQFDDFTISSVLGFSEKIEALKRIYSGIGTENDYDLLDNDWDAETRFSLLLQNAGLNYLSADRKIKTLSGGEKARILCLAQIEKSPDFLLLDEPTNHLDDESKSVFYSLISHWKKGLIVVSHDRKLLRLMDQIAEFDSNGLKFYGGNYDFYTRQKLIESEAAESEYVSLQKEFKKERERIRLELEKSEKQNNRAKAKAIGTGISKMARGIMQRSAENSVGKKKEVFEDRLNNLTTKIAESKSKLSKNHYIEIDLDEPNIHSSKIIMSVKSVNFKIEIRKMLWETPINFEIIGSERIAVQGKNGSGKSLLCKMIMQEIVPTVGEIYRGSKNIGFLDRTVSLLNDNQCILENMMHFSNNLLPEHELRIRLGRFLFYKDSVFRKCGSLSGGERIRAGLACILASGNAPELLILDEPNNNLDLNSLTELTSALQNYKGALMVISHDQDFVRSLNIDRMVRLDRLNKSHKNKNAPQKL